MQRDSYPLPHYVRPYSYGYNSFGYSTASAHPHLFYTETPKPHYPTPTGSSSSDSEEESQPVPAQAPASHLFRPVDFDSVSKYYPPTPTDSDSGSTENDSPSHAGSVSVSLAERELWEAFSRVGNEMIVTKPGRRLFPAVVATIRGLEPDMQYIISLRVTPADRFRYKFLSSHWIPVGESEIMQNELRQVFQHPNSPKSGEFWMKKPICFKAVKITHNTTSKQGNILLHTMHKYVIDVLVQPVGVDLSSAIKIRLPETTFVAVTSYQNTHLTQLKINNNPFAKGFRDRETVIPVQPGDRFLLPPPHLYSRPLWKMPHLASPLPYPVPLRPQSCEQRRDSSGSPGPELRESSAYTSQPFPHLFLHRAGPLHAHHNPMYPFYPPPHPAYPWPYGSPACTNSPTNCSADCSDIED